MVPLPLPLDLRVLVPALARLSALPPRPLPLLRLQEADLSLTGASVAGPVGLAGPVVHPPTHANARTPVSPIHPMAVLGIS